MPVLDIERVEEGVEETATVARPPRRNRRPWLHRRLRISLHRFARAWRIDADQFAAIVPPPWTACPGPVAYIPPRRSTRRPGGQGKEVPTV